MLKIIESYTLTQYINKGAYGKVYKAINHDTQENVAIKMISLEKFTENPKLIQLTKQEVEILSIVENNPNIIKLKEIIKSNRYLYMVYEYCEGGTLEEYLSKINGNNNNYNARLTEKQAILIFKQLINAYKSLYENNIVHRDIKTDNIFFKDGKLKLADFGFSKRLKHPDDLMQTSLGSPLYMAPEVLNNDVYGSKADLWSCGVILYQMLFNSVPYSTCNIKQLLEHYSNKSEPVIRIPSTTTISPTILKMLNRILTKDQFRRISWEEFLYEYQFNDNGEVSHRERDFEYDLMKLMKRNSSEKSEGKDNVIECKSIKSIGSTSNKVKRFDWGKLTEIDLSSSVHSEECMEEQQENEERLRLSSPCFHQITNNNHYLQQQQNKTILSSYSSSKFIQSPYFSNAPNNNNTNPNHATHFLSQHNIPLQEESETNQKITTIYNTKKSIKHFEQEHTKILEVLLILEEILESDNKKEHICDLRVCYFIAYNLQWLLEKNVKEIREYIKANNQLLQEFNLQEEHKKLEKLERIFVTELEANRTKINSIKILLLTVNDLELGKEVFQYPKKREVVKKVMKEYVELYEVENEGILDVLVGGDKSIGGNSVRGDNNSVSVDRSEQIRLLRVLWAVQLVQQEEQNDNDNGNNNVSNNKNNNNTNNKTIVNKKPLSFNPYSSLSIKEQTTAQELSVLINRYLIELKI